MTAVTKGVDYSFSRPGPDGLKRAGYDFAIRYLSGGTSGKDITPGELASFNAAGIAVGFVWETTGGAAKGGRAAGIADASAARKQLAALGVTGRPIYFAVDYDPSGTPEMNAAVAYIQGAASVLGPSLTGVYGGLRVVNACATAKACAWFWQTYAWSGGVFSPVAQLRQVKNGQTVAGGTVDLCEATVPYFGQWPGPSTVKPGLPAPRVYPGRPVGWSFRGVADMAFLQRCLQGAGYKVPISGVFDSATRNAVARYQAGHPWAFLRDQPCGPGAVKARTWASLSTYYGKA